MDDLFYYHVATTEILEERNIPRERKRDVNYLKRFFNYKYTWIYPIIAHGIICLNVFFSFLLLYCSIIRFFSSSSFSSLVMLEILIKNVFLDLHL